MSDPFAIETSELRKQYGVVEALRGLSLQVPAGSIYGFLTPGDMAARKPGEWQAFDVTLVGRMVTVVLNGSTIISNQEIPGITGAALDSHEGQPGPLLLQGDHGPIEFRNLTVARAR